MKPSIPDTGTVISLEGGNAVVRMQGGGNCRKCGAAALGLCAMGRMQVLTVRNTEGAQIGDTVRIGLVRHVQYAGYVLAYVVPAAAFLAGAVVGHYLGSALGFAPLDILSGLFLLVTASYFSYRRLRILDSNHAIEIVTVLHA